MGKPQLNLSESIKGKHSPRNAPLNFRRRKEVYVRTQSQEASKGGNFSFCSKKSQLRVFLD